MRAPWRCGVSFNRVPSRSTQDPLLDRHSPRYQGFSGSSLDKHKGTTVSTVASRLEPLAIAHARRRTRVASVVTNYDTPLGRSRCGLGRTLAPGQEAGSPGLWEGQGFWTAEDREQSITLREVRTALLLHQHFAEYVSRPEITKLILHEDNLRVVSILNSMVSASPVMMDELRKLKVLMRALGVKIQVRWLPSAVNRFADALSRTWDPSDFRATGSLVASIYCVYGLSHIVSKNRPLGETMVSRTRYLATQMGEDWGDGRSRLRHPPFDALPPSAAEDRNRRRKRRRDRPTLADTSLVRPPASPVVEDHCYRAAGVRAAAAGGGEGGTLREVGGRGSRAGLAAKRKAGLQAIMLSKTGSGESTGGGEAAAEMIAQYKWADGTWRNRSNQISRWFCFCEEEKRDALPAKEGDVLAYVGFLDLEGRVNPRSARGYVSAVSQYHLDHGFASPILTRLVTQLLDAFESRENRVVTGDLARIGLGAGVMRRILNHGLSIAVPSEVGYCATVIYAFIYQCRDATVSKTAPGDVTTSLTRITAARRKGRRHRRPLKLDFAVNPDCAPGTGPHDLLQSWLNIRPSSAGCLIYGPDSLSVLHPWGRPWEKR